MGGTDNRNNNIELIREALGNPDGCEIDYEVEEVEFYTIRPKNNQEMLYINSGIDIIKIQALNLQFKRCIFDNKTLFKDIEFQKDIGFQQDILFSNCRFNKSVDFSNAKFKKSICFIESTFEKDAYFKKATFSEGISFYKSISKGNVEFSYSKFNDMADFSKTIFRQKVLFKGSLFNEKTIFDDVKFGDIESARNTYVSFSDANFKNKVEFSRAHFQYEADFQESHFEDVLDFEDAIFLQKADFERAQFKKDVHFSKSIFKQDASFKNIMFYGDAKFNNAKFQIEDISRYIADFSGSHFKERAFFTKTHFHKMANFSNVIFDHNAYFDEAIFEGTANFSLSEFYKNAHFYGTKFKEIPQQDNITMSDIPNFLQIILNGYINLTNTKQLLISFEQLKSIIDENNKKEKDELANEFRNTFKNFKNGLIKDNNLIDASQFHKMELYAKELEANYKKEKSAKDWAEKIQLMLYRLTSDHHTDLLLILNNVIILIACFGAVNFVFNLHSYNYFKVNSLTIEYAIGALIACSIFAILAICLILGCCKKLFDSFGLVIDNVRLFLLKALSYKEQHTTKCPRACIVFFSYIITAIILAVKPALLVPIFGQMIDSKSSIGFAFASLNVIYAIFMFLLIFSLQKTARKNTIVPN